MERVSSSTMKLMKNANRVYQQVIVKAGWIMTKETTTMIPVLVNRPHPIGRQSSLNAAAQISHPFQWFSTSNSSISISSFIFVFLSSATEWPALFSAGNSLISKELLQNTEFRHRVMRKWIQIPPFVSNIAHRRKHGQGCLTLNANHLMIKIKNRSGTASTVPGFQLTDSRSGCRSSWISCCYSKSLATTLDNTRRTWGRQSFVKENWWCHCLLLLLHLGWFHGMRYRCPAGQTNPHDRFLFPSLHETGNEEEHIHRSFINRFL